MNFKTVFMALTVAAMAAFGTGCGSACDDLQDCCDAIGSGACVVSDDADDDQCQAALDLFAAQPGAPDECK
ncbi:MAG: hypothetical protein WKG00_24940 [Polyangiaceae bacterium]